MKQARLFLIVAASWAASCGVDVTSPTPLPGVLTNHGEALLVGAGDIGLCGSPAAEATAKLLDGMSGVIFTAGDNAYPSGSAESYRDC